MNLNSFWQAARPVFESKSNMSDWITCSSFLRYSSSEASYFAWSSI